MSADLDALRFREYWTTGECARVLGRSGEFWARLFDAGVVAGYRDGARYIAAASARAHLRALCEARGGCAEPVALEAVARGQMADFRARMRAEFCAQGKGGAA